MHLLLLFVVFVPGACAPCVGNHPVAPGSTNMGAEGWLAAWLGSGAQKLGMQRPYLSPPLLVGREGAQQAARDALCLQEPLRLSRR